ncbi:MULTISPECIES: Cna B-type domain-containing protein, partial [unclassified Streptococcus]
DQYQDGKAIQYTVEEEAVAGYTTQIDGTLITNSHVPKGTPPATQPPVGEPTQPQAGQSAGTKKILPATNSTTSLGLIVLGLVLLVGLGVYLVKKGK